MKTAARGILERHGYALSFWLLLALVVGERARLVARFAWRYTDKDQALMWTAAHELLRGRLHEPRFYGQASGSMIEGWLAAPLAAAGLSYPVAVPIVTSALALLPFAALAACAWRGGLRASALGVLALPLLLPLEYGLVTSVPRGLVGGLAVAAVAACLTMTAHRSGPRLFAIALLIGLSVSIHPNAGIVAAPLGMLLLLERPRALWPWGGAGLAVAAAVHLLSAWFYRAHPTHVVHGTDLPDALDFGVAVPVLLGVGLIRLGRARAGAGRSTRWSWRPAAVACLALVAIAAWRAARLDRAIERNPRAENEGDVAAWPVETVRDRCRGLAELAERHGAELVVFQTADEVLAYGCEPLLEGRIRTLLVRSDVAERRTWRIADELGRGERTAILYNVSETQLRRIRSLGARVGPDFDVGGIRACEIDLPPGLPAFGVLAVMGLDGAADLSRRARAVASSLGRRPARAGRSRPAAPGP